MTGQRRRSYWFFAAFAVTACLVIAACSPAARYRAFRKVFDGVPVPPGVEAPTDSVGADEDVSAFQEGLRKLRADRVPLPEKPKILSIHKPVAERRCNECHDMDRADSGVSTDATLCDKCHQEQRKKEGWDHGPINLGTCIPCHVAHKSQHEHLLAIAIPELCLNCHETVSPDAPEYHAVANFKDCTACHDPHRMY